MATDIRTRVPFTISNRTIAFYLNGKQWTLSADQPEFPALRVALQTPGPHDHGKLLALVDVRQALLSRSNSEMQFDEKTDSIIWRGKPLQGLWVEKILDYRKAGEPFEPIWNALQRLVRNPTETAIERLPIFLERANLGFLEDGRFLAFKGVTAEFYSAHQGIDGKKFRHLVGDICEMPREQVDADPNQTCSTGLHVGAPGYVKGNYSGASYALVLVAVGPEDVVAVPTDYSGEKMRVCKYEVIDHLDKDYNDELLGRLRTTQAHGYTQNDTPPPPPSEDWSSDPEAELEPYEVTKVGDVIEYNEHEGSTFGTIVEIDENDKENRIRVVGLDGDQLWVNDTDFVRIVDADEVTAAMVTFTGCRVYVEGHDTIRDGTYDVTGIREDREMSLLDQSDGDDLFFEITNDGVPITNGCIQTVVNPEGIQIFPKPLSEFEKLKFDDVVAFSTAGQVLYGRVVSLEPTMIRTPFGNIEQLDEVHFNERVVEDDVRPAMVAHIGCIVSDGTDTFKISAFSDHRDQSQSNSHDAYFKISDLNDDGSGYLRNDWIKALNFEGEHLWPRSNLVADKIILQSGTLTEFFQTRAEVGDLVEIDGNGFPPAGIYPVIEVYAHGYVLQTEHDGKRSVMEDRVIKTTRRPWLRVKAGDRVEISDDPRGVSDVPAGIYLVTREIYENDFSKTALGVIDTRDNEAAWIEADRVTRIVEKFVP